MPLKDKRIKVYIAGPMRGHKEDNYPEFFKAERRLDAKKIYKVVNPARMDKEEECLAAAYSKPYDIDHKEALKRDIDEIFKVESMYFLRGWERSEGARVEHALAIYLGLSIEYQ